MVDDRVSESGLIIPGLENPPETQLPEDASPIPFKLLEKLRQLGYETGQNPSGLSVVSKPITIEPPTSPSQKEPVKIELDSSVSASYLQEQLTEAIALQLDLKEFKENKQVVQLFQSTYQALEAIEKTIYPQIIIGLQAQIANLEFKLKISDDPQKRQELEEYKLILNSPEKLQEYILEIIKQLDINQEKLPQEIKDAFALIQSSSIETIEQLAIITTQLISSTKEFTLPKTKKMLEVLNFVINYKGRFKKELLLSSLSGVSSVLVDALRNQPLLRGSFENWRLILSIADWLEFSPSDADEFMCYYLESGLSMRNPIIARIAFIAENKFPQGKFAKEQEKRRQIFAENYQEAENKGLLDLFLQPEDKDFDQKFKEDINNVLKESLSFEEFIKRYLPTIDEDKKSQLMSQYSFNKEKDTLNNFFENLQSFLKKGRKITDQIIFTIPPSELKGKIGYEVEAFVYNGLSDNVPLFKLPPEFHFSFPSYRERENGFLIEIKPNFSSLEGSLSFEAALKLTLWARRNQRIIQSQSFHIHLDRDDFSSFEDFYTKKCFLLSDIRLGINKNTWEIRQLSAIPNDHISFLNSLLIGKFSQSTEPEEWQKGLFGRLSKIPTNPNLLNQWLESKIIINGRSIKLVDAIKKEPEEFDYVIKRIFSSPHEGVGIVFVEKLADAIKEEPRKFEYIIDSILSSPHEKVVNKFLENEVLINSIANAIKEEPGRFESVIEKKIEKLRRKGLLGNFNYYFFLKIPKNKQIFSGLFF